MKNFKNYLLLGLVFTGLSHSILNAQEAEEPSDESDSTFTFSGSVDTYCRASFSEDPVHLLNQQLT